MERLSPIQINEGTEIILSPDTQFIEYKPQPIDEYLVIVNQQSDWEEIHNYIINENEIDGIPNRKIECVNSQEFSLRSSIYSMSVEEAEILKNHPKIETVELNPEKYPQPESLMSLRYKKDIAFNKPRLVANLDSVTPVFVDGIRSNWSHLFVNSQSSAPFQGVGIASTTNYNSDIEYSLSGKDVDAVIIDSGIGMLHPEFLDINGKTRVRDLILDGPYKVDPEYFDSNNLTYEKVVDGVNIGVGIATTAARSWWSNSSLRSSEFSSIGTVSIDSRYDYPHVSTKTTNSNGNQLIDGHGTACASQIGGKTFGLAKDCNLWNIRISLGGVGGYLSGSTALNACAVFHKAKRIFQNNNPDPTIINNSWGQTSSTGNNAGTVYTHGYRGITTSYTGIYSVNTPYLVPSGAGACRNNKYFTVNSIGLNARYAYTGDGQYIPVSAGASSSSGAENAIASGCIVLAAAGNNNQKLSDSSDIDFDNWYLTSTNYINRCGGVQKGFSGLDDRKSGTIRVGALDCSVEPVDSKQGSTPYSIRKVTYSNNGPMINVWAPGEMTMAAGYYGSYEDYQREDDSNFYDTWFNGTSAACPNACSVLTLYLEANRKATQFDVMNWIDNHGSKDAENLSDPYPNPEETGYWSVSYDPTFDASSFPGDSYNIRGNGNLRGAPRKVLNNPFANNTKFEFNDVVISDISVSQS
jgi:hypothetical protein